MIFKILFRVGIASLASVPIPPRAEIKSLFIVELDFRIASIIVGTASLPILRSASTAFPRTLSTLSNNILAKLLIISGLDILNSPITSIAPFLTVGFL